MRNNWTHTILNNVLEKFWEKDDRSSSYGQRAPAEIDYSKVPDEPPFKAFISNVSYSATREDLKGFFGGKEEVGHCYFLPLFVILLTSSMFDHVAYLFRSKAYT